MRRHPPSARAAFTLIELMVIVGIIVLLAGVLLPSLRETKRRAQRIDCVGNLKQVGLSFRLWSLDSSDQYPMARSTNYGGTLEVGEDVWRTFLVMSNELGTPSVLFCPADVRLPAASWEALANTNLSYFIGLDAEESLPELILSGDRNLTNGPDSAGPIRVVTSHDLPGWTGAIHGACGNVALADGSVQQWDGSGLHRGLTNALRLSAESRTNATLRLAMPE